MTELINCDVAVVGAGPAGSAAAIRLREAGADTVMVDREHFPRFRIGESLLPRATAMLESLGVGEAVRDAGFVSKVGATFTYEDGTTGGHIVFSEGTTLAGGQAWQVSRERFDVLLLERARALGARFIAGVRATDFVTAEEGVEITLRPHGASGDAGSGGGATSTTVRARYLVDATGQSGFLAKSLDLREPIPGFENVAVHTRFADVAWPTDVPPGNIQVISRRDLGWLWLIPLALSSEVGSGGPEVSVGVVLPRRELAQRSGDSEALLRGAIDEVPAAAVQLGGAELITKVRRDADFTYRTRSYAGERWIVAGDGGSFLDPVFSTGVTLALVSGAEAGEAIGRVLAGSLWAKEAESFERVSARRVDWFLPFVAGFYDPGFRDLFVQPSNMFGLIPALTAVLAGEDEVSLSVRLRLRLFLWLARLQGRTGKVVRSLHDHPA